MAGVIDADYRGQVGVILANLSEQDFEVKVGDRIAQLIVEKVCCALYLVLDEFIDTCQIVMPEVMVVEKLEESVRGADGFGSTGV